MPLGIYTYSTRRVKSVQNRRIPAGFGVMKPRHSRRYATLQQQLAAIGPVSQGSVAFQPPGSWRWTFKVKGKTACVALSEEQAAQMLQEITKGQSFSQNLFLSSLSCPGSSSP